MVDRVSLEHVPRDLLFRPSSIRTDLMLFLLEGHADESLEPLNQATLSEKKKKRREIRN